MEPVTIISLVCNVFDLTERTIKCAKKVKDIYDSTTGFPKEYDRLSELTKELDVFLGNVRSSHGKLREIENEDTNIQDVASECQNFSSDIDALLERCRAKKPASIRSTFGAVIRTYRNKDDLQAIQDSLEERKQTLHLALTASARSQIIKVEKALNEEQVQNDDLKKQLNIVQQKLNTLNDVPDQLQQALNLCRQAQTARELNHVFRILGDRNGGMRSNPRYDEVHATYENTSEWIFHEPEKVFKVKPDLRLSFVDWLRTGRDIFHVLGKPGSGKSTLMKFIWNHEVTKEMLKQWAGRSQLLRMKYFFWRSGSHQNGLQDLRRSLLKSALEQAPELMEILLPRIHECKTALDEYLSDDEISKACELLMKDPRVLERRKIFILIDGLDEFDEENNAEDYDDLVQTIQGWTSQPDGKVKACVSSREYDVFRSIAHSLSFRLQDLTREDMRIFVAGRLKEHSRFSELEYACKQNSQDICRREGRSHECNLDCLIRHIVGSAHGVFLWVWLMICETRRHIGNSLYELWKLVDSKPPELMDFLKQMLDTIPYPHQRESYIILAIVHICETSRYSSPHLWFSLRTTDASYLWNKLLQERAGSDFQLSDPSEPVNWDIFTAEEVDVRFNGLLEVDVRFNGLLEHASSLTPSLVFTHRSIIEVLDECIATKLRPYNVTQKKLGKYICQILLIYTMPQIISRLYFGMEVISILDMLERMNMNVLEEPWCIQQLDHIEDTYWTAKTDWKNILSRAPDSFSLLEAVCTVGFSKLLPWVLGRLSGTPKRGHLASVAILSCLLFTYMGIGITEQPTILKVLLKHGYVGVDILDRGIGVQIPKYGCHTTMPWLHYIRMLVQGSALSREKGWLFCEPWLESGANPRVCHYEDFHLPVSLFVKIEGGWWCARGEYSVITENWKTEKVSLLPPGPKTTLRDLVERSEAPNKERLLELIDRNTAWIEADEAEEVRVMFEELPSTDVLDVPEYVPPRKTARDIWRAYILRLRHMVLEIEHRVTGRTVFTQLIYDRIGSSTKIGIAILASLVLAVSIAIVWGITSDSNHSRRGTVFFRTYGGVKQDVLAMGGNGQ
ncbi:uncharacterized protein F4807DRAFT_324310 [Annulohypoxylon truncatum]|uniref:uncharacterized protein n=1 Tax=Annulohypoxylon truncatum TaxID=327061 RepID=UPI002008015B|nr:uncharacterized protein F4807DRAFT_324310 [Annulohypoxylon truncatum]KAI1204673.1 hypothetical protein F4807DRAFT_324310 [Annulohypoxylon truncatum]